MRLLRLTRSWLEEGDVPGTLDRLVLDCGTQVFTVWGKDIRDTARTPEPKRANCPARKSPGNYGDATKGEGGGSELNGGPKRGRTQHGGLSDESKQTDEPDQRRTAALAAGRLDTWSGGEEARMTTATLYSEGIRTSHYKTTCWTHEGMAAPKISVRDHDTVATLDSRSAVTLVRPDLADDARGEEIKMACVHGDRQSYPTTLIQVITFRDPQRASWRRRSTCRCPTSVRQTIRPGGSLASSKKRN